ncbi:hypothetical protein ABZW30_07325 [Kitasatospora sp. NPDC004669]|uniref:hypothetical protein n=1 Tax=Kitasatospora sp. NPDC004669 TaxID=3154555 RepID=UPI0033A4A9D4
MHGSLNTQPLTIGSISSQVSVLGESDPGETRPRVAVQVTLHLSFAEILGRLLFTSGLMLTHEDLETGNEANIVDCLRFTLAQTGYDTAEDFADMAMDIYTGRRTSNLHAFTVSLGNVITHVFGVTAPEPPATPALSLATQAAA